MAINIKNFLFVGIFLFIGFTLLAEILNDRVIIIQNYKLECINRTKKIQVDDLEDDVPRFFFEKDIKIWKNITQGIMEHDVG
jgi:hypothetical protein